MSSDDSGDEESVCEECGQTGTLRKCPKCYSFVHAACMMAVVASFGTSTSAISASSHQEQLCAACCKELEDECASDEDSGGDDEEMPVGFDEYGIHCIHGHGWVPEGKVTKRDVQALWCHLERNTGARKCEERLGRVMKRFKTVMMAAAFEMARPERPCGPVSLFSQLRRCPPTCLVYFSGGTAPTDSATYADECERYAFVQTQARPAESP